MFARGQYNNGGRATRKKAAAPIWGLRPLFFITPRAGREVLHHFLLVRIIGRHGRIQDFFDRFRLPLERFRQAGQRGPQGFGVLMGLGIVCIAEQIIHRHI